VLALPAEARLLGERLLQDGGGVDHDLDPRAEAGGDEAGELLQPALEHVVVVAVAGVDGDVGPVAALQAGQRVLVRAVAHAADDGAAGLGPEGGGGGAQLGIAGEPIHVAVPAGGDERAVALADLGRERGGGEADDIEAERGGAAADLDARVDGALARGLNRGRGCCGHSGSRRRRL
jgi:hypothetical protein